MKAKKTQIIHNFRQAYTSKIWLIKSSSTIEVSKRKAFIELIEQLLIE